MADKNFGVKEIQLVGDLNEPTISIASSTITYASNDGSLNLNAPAVAISTDVSIGGKVLSNLIVSNSYSVGIGTTDLTQRLNVSGNANISGVVTASQFFGSGSGLTGLIPNAIVGVDSSVYQYFLFSTQTSGSISSLSASSGYLIFNPASKFLGIGAETPSANLDVTGTGRFTTSVTSPSFQGTATTATNLENAANITTGIVSTSRLSGTYDINITGTASTATTTNSLSSSININTSGIITASSFVGNVTGTATTASGLSTDVNINTSGIITASSFVGNITGLASSATQLQNIRYLSVSGDVSTASSIAFDGTQNVGLAVTLALSGVSSGTYGSSTSIPSITVNDKGLIIGVTTSGIVVGDGTLNLNTSGTGLSGIATFTANQATGTAVTFTVTSNATSNNTSNTIVARDSGGNFSAETITANLSGTATTAVGLTTTSSVNTSGIITATKFSTGIATQTIGITTGLISGPNTIFISPNQVGLSTGTVRILGNLQVDGTTVTTVQQTIQSSAKTVGVAVSETDNIILDGSGITIGSTAIQKTLLWNYGSSSLKSSENFNLTPGKVYQINDNEVLSSTKLADSVVTSGLTTVGTLKQLNVSGVSTISVNSSSDALRITQLGSGNALVVEDSANPDATPFVVGAAGSVGIGTTNPVSDLDVDGPIISRYGAFVVSSLNSSALWTDPVTATNVDHIWHNDGVSSAIGSTWGLGGMWNFVSDSTYQADGNSWIRAGGFANTTPTLGSSYPLQISGNAYVSGNLGIGTTNPTEELHLYNNQNSGTSVLITNSDTGTTAHAIFRTNATTSSVSLISHGSGRIISRFGQVLASMNEIVATIGNGILVGTQNATPLILGTNDTEALRIDSSQRVGIGTTNPTSKLHVVGDALVTGVVTATDFNSTSDFKLKTNIQQIEDSLSKVIQIRGVTFNWKDTNRTSAGVIAQEVEKVLPELISGEETKTVNYNGIIGALVEAVKELKVENDILRERLEEVHKKVFG